MTSPSGAGSFMILVVDDEATMRRSLADILRLEGYLVQVAESGERAIELMKNQVYNLLLLDLKMPGVDGVEVLRFANHHTPDTQVILLTAHGSLESAIEALRLGARDYLRKPSSPEMILESVAKAYQARAEQMQREELLTRLESSVVALKRSQGNHLGNESQPETWELEHGVRFDFNRRLIWNEADQISLTSSESKLLQVLLEHRSYIFNYQELVSRVQGYETTRHEAVQVLRPLISRLRQKLSCFPGSGSWIVNIRSQGYGFKPQDLR